MRCKYCQSESVIKYGKKNGTQVYQCKACRHTFMDTGNYVKMRIDPQIINTAMDMYFEGLSLRKIQRQLRLLYQVDVNHTTIWGWIGKYGTLTKKYVDSLMVNTGDKWHIDETCISCDGENKWLWNVIDADTRFLVASVLTGDRSIASAIKTFREAKGKVKQRPKKIIADGLRSYKQGFNKTLWDSKRSTRLISNVGISGARTNNMVERVHGTLKDRLKPMRGIGKIPTASKLIDGWYVHYNFLREHSTLKDRPANVAGIDLGLPENGWGKLIGLATKFDTFHNPLPGQTKITAYN